MFLDSTKSKNILDFAIVLGSECLILRCVLMKLEPTSMVIMFIVTVAATSCLDGFLQNELEHFIKY